jgi:hypothetical protein
MPHDLALHGAPGGGKRVASMCGADEEDVSDSLRCQLSEGQAHHSAIRGAREGVQPPNTQAVADREYRGSLIT